MLELLSLHMQIMFRKGIVIPSEPVMETEALLYWMSNRGKNQFLQMVQALVQFPIELGARHFDMLRHECYDKTRLESTVLINALAQHIADDFVSASDALQHAHILCMTRPTLLLTPQSEKINIREISNNKFWNSPFTEKIRRELEE